MDDPFDLARFVDAQRADYARAAAELRNGRKVGHWIWYVFPQIAGLGSSPTAQHYAIGSLAEARAFLAHPDLGPRLVQCARLLLSTPNRSAEQILGGIDALKVRSSMTLFQAADPDEPAFGQVLDGLYDGRPDGRHPRPAGSSVVIGTRFIEQTLIFDADDTLWENNVLFERVVEDFTDWLAHPTLDRAAVRAILDEIEAANTVVHGVGAETFLRNLGQAFEHLADRPRTAADEAQIRVLAKALLDHEIVLMPEVADTLTELASRHRVLLLTRGSVPEQQRKIDASGLAELFESTHIVAHKVPDTYRQLAADKGLDIGRSWMIGNSPKSDILPARAVGMRAVYIPNPDTWSLEMTDLDGNDEGVVTLTSFGHLTTLF